MGDGGNATVVISMRVREGREREYQRWQDRTTAEVREFGGFEGTEQYPPAGGPNGEWTTIYRFGSVDQLGEWLASPQRRGLLDEADDLFEAPPNQSVLAGEEAVTAIINHQVRPGREDAFVRWQDRIRDAQKRFQGFLGFELFRPVPGLQEDWVAVIRFDNREHLDAWLTSATRAALLDEAHDSLAAFDVRTVQSPFRNWFRFDDQDPGMPPNWKQVMSVVLALYPTVVALSLTVGLVLNRLEVPGFLALFISNILSVSILTWFLMPLVNKAFASWLAPAPSRRANLLGVAAMALAYTVLIGLTALLTT